VVGCHIAVESCRLPTEHAVQRVLEILCIGHRDHKCRSSATPARRGSDDFNLRKREDHAPT
jgi:hypothetical protein